MKSWWNNTPLKAHAPPPFPGIRSAMDGSAAVVEMETAAGEAAGAYPITPSTQMGEGWAVAVADGKRNVNGRRLIFFEPEGEHAAAAVTAGMSMTGLRATNFSSGQGIAYMHESLYAAVGKRLTYVLNVAARAMTKHALNVHAGHDDYHSVDDTGFFQLFAKDVQEAADLNLIARRVAELALNPGMVAQDGFLTSHVIETLLLPENDLIRRYLGDPADLIESPTPAQRLMFGERRRRVPELFDVDYPAMLGTVQNQDSYAQGVAAQRPFYFDHVASLTDAAMAEFATLTGRRYARASGYRVDDADYVIVGQGSVVSNAEAVVDYLREARDLRIGVVNLTMFRPFPSDIITHLLAGRKGVVVLERTDQPLAVDPPLLRELRAALSQAVENSRGRKGRPLPFPNLPALVAGGVPDFYSGCFGMGSRDLQPGDMIAAVENMLPDGKGRRQFYLGLDFVRPNTRLPKLQIWQEKLLDSYPDLADLALPNAGDFDLMPDGAVSLRIHSVGGWGAITMGKNLSMTVFELLGMHIKANPKYGSEKKGQPTTFYATLAREPVRLNCELRQVDVVLSPDPNSFRHSDPLAGLRDDGVFVIQGDQSPEAFWTSLPAAARRTMRERRIRVYTLDAFSIASSEASDAELRYRMQGAAFMGAFFAVAPLMEREGLDREKLFEGIRAQLSRKFGAKGERVVEDNLRVIRRGFDEVKAVDTTIETDDAEVPPVPRIHPLMDVPNAQDGVGNPGRFWEQVCGVCKTGQDVIADPFAALGAVPAATSAVRDMTNVRMEVPDFIAEKCTGCGQCWTQCPDSAIPGLVSDVDDLIGTALRIAGEGGPVDRLRQVAKPLGKEARKLLAAGPYHGFGKLLTSAYETLVPKLDWDPERRAAADSEFARVHAAIADLRLARTAPFHDVPERKVKGSGGLLSVVVNPEACKGCNLCVEVCPDDALVTVRQDDEIVSRLRREWEIWQKLPDTHDRFINVSDLEEGIGVLPSLLLKKATYRTMVGGDGSCMGCGEKTAVHLIVGTVESLMSARVERRVARIDELIAGLSAKVRTMLTAEAEIESLLSEPGTAIALPLDDPTREEADRIAGSLRALKELRWRYVEGPSGRGRASLAMTNSTGCSSVWGSTFPYNPYPFPWANHLFQDSPSLAIGVFEGHMRKMAGSFATVRRAELLLSGDYDAASHEQELCDLEWPQFTDEELALCPPIIAMGGDGAMLDIGFQNLSRLLASGKPIKVIVLDTQVYSNTGGQACTSGYTGQVSDMAAFGAAQHGKTEERKELALIAIAHRGAFVHQSSQASAAHLMGGVIRAMGTKRPAVVNVYTPCPVEHGLPDESAMQAARLALESRAFPYLTFDPDAGSAFADCLDLSGNPALDDDWPTRTIEYVDDDGAPGTMELPLTIADWAATEGRFRKHFKPLPRERWSDEMLPFHEYLQLAGPERAERVPFVYTIDRERRLSRLKVSPEIVKLTEERRLHWAQLRELAGVKPAPVVREEIARQLEAEFDQRASALRAEYEAKIASLQATYPAVLARKLAEGLIRASSSGQSLGDFLAKLPPVAGGTVGVSGDLAGYIPGPQGHPTGDAGAFPAATGGPSSAAPTAAAAMPEVGAGAATAVAAPEDDGIAMEAYIESVLCTTCNECTNLNGKMFAYNKDKQAYIRDPKAGTFQQMVLAAERCPVLAIHPGTPLNPNEKDLDKWLKRARAF
jgi:pyruvate-ferredoxin/flavodoxin oxidoreductase